MRQNHFKTGFYSNIRSVIWENIHILLVPELQINTALQIQNKQISVSHVCYTTKWASSKKKKSSLQTKRLVE